MDMSVSPPTGSWEELTGTAGVDYATPLIGITNWHATAADASNFPDFSLDATDPLVIKNRFV